MQGAAWARRALGLGQGGVAGEGLIEPQRAPRIRSPRAFERLGVDPDLADYFFRLHREIEPFEQDEGWEYVPTVLQTGRAAPALQARLHREDPLRAAQGRGAAAAHEAALGARVMAAVTIYHNPVCGQSRGALEILHERGVACDVVEYLKAPLDRATLERFLELLPDPPADLVRKDKRFKELGLDPADYTTGEQVVAVLLKHPELMQRPVVVRDTRAVLARPSEKVLALLDDGRAHAGQGWCIGTSSKNGTGSPGSKILNGGIVQYVCFSFSSRPGGIVP